MAVCCLAAEADAELGIGPVVSRYFDDGEME